MRLRISLRRFLVSTTFLAAALPLAGVGCGPGSGTEASAGPPIYSRDGAWVAFTSDRSGNNDIYVSRVGAAADRITDSDHGSGQPWWSADGSKIVFSRSTDRDWPDPGSSGLFVVNRDGSELRQVTSGDDYWPCWAADDATIVFQRGFGAIYAIDVDGTNLRRLVRNAETPACSPARPTIAFAGATGIGILDLKNGSLRIVSPRETVEDSVPAWSRDGRQIAFETQRPRSPDDPVLDGPSVAPWYFAEIYVANADGSGLRRLTENSVGDRWPTWLPDGRIFFVSNRAGPQDLTNSDASEYYVMNSDGTGVQLSRWNPSYS